eukprot:CAMPEP_0118682848 /NCGR_PEP_ID=MMETSP0800-20121206/5705_1 /TAXON_ID=210618 ORGANISM="Striatella unipunctata, Strain CCMP2910" /NCGR_SAMPLE_ID=MMETSP0800 /ASSEMBLY_ACC=CAM_ASM_000638 /LENGTH=471 /DNA_ID=CAMNT_0006579267 /DNA_START=116 /DNA_END=1531 /DNA_ORIENTATION=+
MACLSKAGTRAVNIGMCQGLTDYEVCTGTKDSCNRPDLFVPESDDCTVANDTRTSSLSSYGMCHTVGENGFDEGVCFWESSDCPEDTTNNTVWLVAHRGDCPCDKVHTGACYFDGTYNCAVSKEACDIVMGETFISAQDLRNSQGPSCRLCGEGGVVNTTTTIKHYVQAGACMINGKLDKCVLTKEECKTGTYESPLTLRSSPSSQEAVMCLTRSATEELTTGRCNSDLDDFICTGSPDTCQDEFEFVSPAHGCNMLADTSTTLNTGRARYGACEHTSDGVFTDKTCFWDKKDCPLTLDEYIPNGFNWLVGRLATDCTCEVVETGACKDNGALDDITCAVSHEACDTSKGEIWIAALHLKALTGVDCRLCRPYDPFSPTLAPTRSPSGPTIRYPTYQPTEQTGIAIPEKDEVAIVGILLGTSVGLVLIALLILCCRRRLFPAYTGGQKLSSSPAEGPQFPPNGDAGEFTIT